jgi:hypothetical protein
LWITIIPLSDTFSLSTGSKLYPLQQSTVEIWLKESLVRLGNHRKDVAHAGANGHPRYWIGRRFLLLRHFKGEIAKRNLSLHQYLFQAGEVP